MSSGHQKQLIITLAALELQLQEQVFPTKSVHGIFPGSSLLGLCGERPRTDPRHR